MCACAQTRRFHGSILGRRHAEGGKPSIHAHGVGCGHDFTAAGGHLLALTVGRGSLELMIVVHPSRLERREDPAIGAHILRLPMS